MKAKLCIFLTSILNESESQLLTPAAFPLENWFLLPVALNVLSDVHGTIQVCLTDVIAGLFTSTLVNGVVRHLDGSVFVLPLVRPQQQLPVIYEGILYGNFIIQNSV